MSTQAVHDLLAKAEHDGALRSALETALRDEAQGVQRFLETAREHGCEFTAKEFLGVMSTQSAGELSDSQLEGVAGGLTLSSSWTRLATRVFSSYTTTPSIRTLGPGSIAQSEEEEEIQL